MSRNTRGGNGPTKPPVARSRRVALIPRATRRSNYVNSRAARWEGGGDASGFGIDFLDGGNMGGFEQPGGWGNQTPNANLGGFPTLVRRMRDLESFVPAFKGAIDIWCDEVLGKSGVLPNFDKWPGLQELFGWWMGECDFDESQNLDFVGKEEQGLRMERRDGNYIIRHIHQADMSRVPMSRVPYQFQILQIDHLPTWYSMPLPNGGYISAGRQFAANGKLQGYWLFPVHPRDFQLQFATQKFPVPIWVDVSEITIVRGIGEPGSAVTTPPMRTATPGMRETHEFMDSESIRMRNNSNTGLLISAPNYSDDDEVQEGMFPGSTGQGGPGTGGRGPALDAAGMDVSPMDPGGAVIVPPGWKVEQSQAGEVGTSFGEFLKKTWTSQALGAGVPYYRYADDYSAVLSDRIGKIADRDFDVRISRYRSNIHVRQHLRPIIRRFAIAAYVSGEWNPEAGTDMREVYMCPVINPRRNNTHELQGEQAAEIAIKNGLESGDDLAAKRGKKGSQIDVENAVAQERKRLLGQVTITSTGVIVAFPQPPDTPAGKRITEMAQRVIDAELAHLEGSTRVNQDIKPSEQIGPDDMLTDTFDEEEAFLGGGLYVSAPVGSVIPG